MKNVLSLSIQCSVMITSICYTSANNFDREVRNSRINRIVQQYQTGPTKSIPVLTQDQLLQKQSKTNKYLRRKLTAQQAQNQRLCRTIEEQNVTIQEQRQAIQAYLVQQSNIKN